VGLHADARFARARIGLTRALARAAAPLERLRQTALRLANNPRVRSVAAVLATIEIGRWLAASPG